MKKFDFSKEFGNIDPKYIEEAEREWSEKKENRRPKGWSKTAAAACVIVTLGSVIFSNPHIQAAIKNITLSIGETLGFPKGIESYTEVLNTSKEDKGITVTLKEVVLDNGVLLTKVHAEKTSSGQKDTDDVQDDWSFANTQLDIDYQKTTINGQKIEEYESGHLLPYSDEDLLNTGLDENVYDAVLESRFSLDGDLGENPEIHLVLGAYQNENLGEDYFAEFEFDFSIPHEELMKQTVHKKLEDVSVKTEEGTVKLTDFSMNKLQSIIKAEIPEELEEKLYNGNEMMLMGTDSKGNQVQYELCSNSADGKSQWSFKTSFWGMYQLDSDGPVLLLPDIDSDYLELQLYTREPFFIFLPYCIINIPNMPYSSFRQKYFQTVSGCYFYFRAFVQFPVQPFQQLFPFFIFPFFRQPGIYTCRHSSSPPAFQKLFYSVKFGISAVKFLTCCFQLVV